MPRRAYGEYPSNVSDEGWAFCAPYLTLMREDAPQRDCPLRDVFNALRWFVRADCPRRQMPNDLPPWWVVQQQSQRWMVAGVFELMAQDLRALLRELLHGRKPVPSGHGDGVIHRRRQPRARSHTARGGWIDATVRRVVRLESLRHVAYYRIGRRGGTRPPCDDRISPTPTTIDDRITGNPQ